MKPAKTLVLIVLGVLVVLAGAAAAGVSLPLADRSGRSPCDQLPSKQAVTAAVSSHPDLVTRIQDVGPAVKVSIATPCKGQPDRAIVSIAYGSDAERDGLEEVLRQNDGFGVELELQRK